MNFFPRNFFSNPEPKKAAVKKVKPKKAAVLPNHLEGLILDAVRSFKEGCIIDDLELCIPEHRVNAISPRIRPMIGKGLLEETGERRKARSGRYQRVIRAK